MENENIRKDLIKMAVVLRKRDNLDTEVHTKRESNVWRCREKMVIYLLPGKRITALRKKPNLLHLDLRLPASRTVRQ